MKLKTCGRSSLVLSALVVQHTNFINKSRNHTVPILFVLCIDTGWVSDSTADDSTVEDSTADFT